MSAAAARAHLRWQDAPVSFWLPPAGTGNGLTAEAWAAVADLPDDVAAARMLAACARVRIAAYSAPAAGHRPGRGRRQRLWVDVRSWATAQDVLRAVLAADQPASTRGRVDGAGREPARRGVLHAHLLPRRDRAHTRRMR